MRDGKKSIMAGFDENKEEQASVTILRWKDCGWHDGPNVYTQNRIYAKEEQEQERL